jgi:hypothetical protein
MLKDYYCLQNLQGSSNINQNSDYYEHGTIILSAFKRINSLLHFGYESLNSITCVTVSEFLARAPEVPPRLPPAAVAFATSVHSPLRVILDVLNCGSCNNLLPPLLYQNFPGPLSGMCCA